MRHAIYDTRAVWFFPLARRLHEAEAIREPGVIEASWLALVSREGLGIIKSTRAWTGGASNTLLKVS